MKKLKDLNDSVLLGEEGLSNHTPRLAARAVLRRRDGKYALMYTEKFDLYSLPGGGVEKGEGLIDALKREMFEETGCSCDKIRVLGYVYENRACHNFTQKSFYFAVKAEKHIEKNRLTPKERAVNVKLLWVPYETLVKKITGSNPETAQKKYIQARDAAALEEYDKWLASQKEKGEKNKTKSEK